MANEIKKELIQKKLDLVIQKLMHLGAPENEDTLKEGGEAIGFFSRDFGIKEWDWPQGIGLYGLLKIAKMQDSEEYCTFLHDWFKENIAQGLPSRNINTTTPLLTLCELNEIYHDPEFEALCLDWAKCQRRPSGRSPKRERDVDRHPVHDRLVPQSDGPEVRQAGVDRRIH